MAHSMHAAVHSEGGRGRERVDEAASDGVAPMLSVGDGSGGEQRLLHKRWLTTSEGKTRGDGRVG